MKALMGNFWEEVLQIIYTYLYGLIIFIYRLCVLVILERTVSIVKSMHFLCESPRIGDVTPGV